MNPYTKEELEKLIEELVKLGGNKGELYFWLDFWPVMGDQARENLFKNIQKEITELRKVS